MTEALKPEIVDGGKLPAELSKVERGILRKCERTIERNAAAFVQMADALTTIRVDRLYRETHTSFDAYCQDRWDFTRQRAQQLITAGETVRALPAATATKITSERAARAVKPVADDPVKAAAVVDAATGDDGKASAVAIEQEVAKTNGTKPDPWEGSAKTTAKAGTLAEWVKATDRDVPALLIGAPPDELRKARSLLNGIVATITAQLDDAAKAKRAAAAKGKVPAKSGKRQANPIPKTAKK